MQPKSLFLFVGLILLSLMITPVGMAGAQVETQASSPNCPPFDPSLMRDEGFLQSLPPECTKAYPELMQNTGNQAVMPDITTLATGGPDDFGYTWDDSVAFNWIDATSGTNSGLLGDDKYIETAVDIGFPFKFFENTYSQLFFNTNGLVTFGNGDSAYSNTEIPHQAKPNNLVAVFWDDLTVGQPYNSGNIFYKQGGIAPNRFFVIEWHNVTSCCSANATDFKTFEVLLYENGDIVTQYQTLSGYLESSTVGIEDSMGISGLPYLSNSPGLSNNKAVRFIRPGQLARVQVYPLYQGNFSRAGEMLNFQIHVRNTGELGADVYDLTSSSGWTLSLTAADGTTLLTDTDSDGVIDTGPVSQGATTDIIARVQAPGGANVGDALAATVTARSSLNTSKSKTVRLQSAIPAPFAQDYRDDYDGAMSLYLVQPDVQWVKKTTDGWGYDPAVAEAPNGNFAYAWDKYRCLDNDCNVYGSEIEYTLLNKYGETVRAVSKLSDNSGATVNTYDRSPVVAAAPDGHTGVMWYRYARQYLNNTWQYNYNLFFAVLDASGNVTYGPLNLTNNSSWGGWDAPDVPRFYDPKISATGDNRFVLAWQRTHRVDNCTSNDCYIDDIYYAVRATGGSQVKGITQFTHDATGSSYEAYYYPNLTDLTGNRALMTWARNSDGDIYYAVFDSAGNVVKAETNLSGNDSSSWDWNSDAVQLSDGKVVVGWTGDSNIWFAVLDTNYNRIAFPSSLNNPAATTGNDYVSVTADKAGHAILTWMDSWNNRRNLYYALVNGNGGILTQPMIFRTSQADTPYILTSYTGYGNTSFSSSITAPFRIYLPLIKR